MNPQGSGTQTSLLSNHAHTITALLMMDLMSVKQDIIRALMEKQYIQ